MPRPDSNFSVRISPNILDFSAGDSGRSEEMELAITNITNTDLGIKIVDMPHGFVEGQLSSEVIKPSEEVKLKVKLKEGVEKTRLAKSITCELSDKNKSRFTIPVKR